MYWISRFSLMNCFRSTERGEAHPKRRMFVVSWVQLQRVPPAWLFFTREPVKSNGSIGRVDYEVKGDSLIGSVKSCLALHRVGVLMASSSHTHTHTPTRMVDLLGYICFVQAQPGKGHFMKWSIHQGERECWGSICKKAQWIKQGFRDSNVVDKPNQASHLEKCWVRWIPTFRSTQQSLVWMWLIDWKLMHDTIYSIIIKEEIPFTPRIMKIQCCLCLMIFF